MEQNTGNQMEMLNEGDQREIVIGSQEHKLIHKESEELARENNKIIETAKKNTVEILNVELVAHAGENFVKGDSGTADINSQVNVVNDDNKSISSSLNIFSEENTNEKMELTTNEVGAVTTEVNDNVANCAQNITEPVNNSETMIVSQVNISDKNDLTLPNTSTHVMEEIEMDTSAVANENNNLTNCSENNTETVKTSGLSLLAQYQSDDDDADSVIEVPITTAQDYRNQVVEIDSDSDSEESSDSSSDSDVEYVSGLLQKIEKCIVLDGDDEEDEDNENKSSRRKPEQRLRAKGELLLEDLPPIQDLKITVPKDECIEFGKIHSIVDQLVLVSPLPNFSLLDLDSVLFLEKGQKVLGELFDALGQISDPLYCVRFNSNQHIKDKGIQVGDVVYVAPKTQYTKYIILPSLMEIRGSDASWENDVEPPPKYLDYSDDEQELLAKKQLRNKYRPNDNDNASKRSKAGDEEDDAMPSCSSKQPKPQKNYRGNPAGSANVNNRSRYNGPQQNQQRPANHNPSSWHSNYYPQNYSSQPTNNYGMHSGQNRSQAPPRYNPNMPAYGMPSGGHNMQYPPQQAQYGAPPMFQQYSAPHTPNSFTMPPPAFYGPPPNASHHHQYTSSTPPPPGSQ